MKLIKLTQGKFAKVDDEDYNYLIQWKWYAQKNDNNFYVQRSDKGKSFFMHRVVMKCIEKDGKIIDHKNRDGLDNQKHNLRFSSIRGNCSNRTSFGTSKYLGVCLVKRKNKWFNKKENKYKTAFTSSWTAQISFNNKHAYIGSFKTEEEAGRAYDKKALELHGEFANLNFK